MIQEDGSSQLFREEDLIFDWNRLDVPPWRGGCKLADETLRDGLQSPSVIDPPVERKIEILHCMEELGIDFVDIALPAAGPRALADGIRLAREIASHRMRIRPYCAARTLRSDVDPIREIQDRAGIPVAAATFIGSSPIRQVAEDWNLDRLLHLTEDTVRYCTDNDVAVMYVTEDTVRARPETVQLLYAKAIEAGARWICLCDTVGHATPAGAANLVRFVKERVVDPSGEEVQIDWHGHRDRGLGLANSLAALQAGAHCAHGTALGIGERVGNTEMELLLVNLSLEGALEGPRNFTALTRYVELVSEACGVPIPIGKAVVGRDAFRTATGVHAAAIIKAHRKGAHWLADRVYSGVPAALFGRQQVIEIGPMSGESNVVFYLQQRQIEPTRPLVDALFAAAKASDHPLTESEAQHIIDGELHRRQAGTSSSVA